MNTALGKDQRSRSRDKKKRRLSLRYLAYLIHSFMGLKLTLLLIVVLFTGSIAAIQQELDWLIYDEMRAEVQEQRISSGVLLDRLQAAYPDNGMFFFRSGEKYPHLNAHARFIDDTGGWRHAWIDPYSGEVKGDTALLSIGQFIGYLHATLFLPAIGNSLVNALGLLVLISLITGLMTFPKFWRYFFKPPRTANLRVFLGDLHKLVGLWSLWIVLIIGITGSWWFYQDPFVKYLGAPSIIEPYPQKPLLSYEELDSLEPTGTPDKRPVAEIIQQVQSAYPDLQINIINPPEHSADPYEVVGTTGELLLSEWRGHRIFVNPYTGKIVDAFMVKDLTFMQRTDMAVTPLHYGTWATGASDLVVKLFYFCGGTAMTFLAVSGLVVSYKRTRKAARKAAQHSPLLTKLYKGWYLIRPWGGPMGGFKYLNLIAIVGIAVGTGIALTLSGQGTKGSGFLYQEQTLGPWTVSMNAVAGLLEKDLPPIRPGNMTNLNVALPAEALDKIKFIYARVGKPRTMRAPGTLIHGPIGAKHVHLSIPRKIDNKSELWITAVTWQGDYYQNQWSLMPDGKKTIDAR
ncbi:PepSY domain-containing protein [Motiliproteus sp. MSK22-1]|uniref:PepSY-associated TM helix domain-containing protein n=1 Tax=Motiliproteus sp. MSK22-1 TaxID=1897630 RepID=UPI0009754B91|nr:PepSY-associated TM helix domain-containing protein [Motiliproteus sp. MSK22-1]OMH33662.1 hypothetical protein BGP75_11660 [Motiliproteus sp. MSK22-1]